MVASALGVTFGSDERVAAGVTRGGVMMEAYAFSLVMGWQHRPCFC